MITANIIQQYNMKSLRLEETQNTIIISTTSQEMLSSFVMFPAPQKKESPIKGRRQNKKTSYSVTLSLKVGGGQDQIILL